MTGSVHSIYTGGMVDGPGIRTVVFFAGCSLRCLYCHNPDTWERSHGTFKTVDDVMGEVCKYRSYYKFSGGGITVSGGEATEQPNFLRALLTACRAEGIHTVLDTSGFPTENLANEILPLVDLLLLDVKAFRKDTYKRLTGSRIERPIQTLHAAKRLRIPVQINYVLVPNLTDNREEITEMGTFFRGFDNIQKIEVLPFHKHGEHKWAELNLDYQLSDVLPPTKEDTANVLHMLTHS